MHSIGDCWRLESDLKEIVKIIEKYMKKVPKGTERERKATRLCV